MISTKPKLFVTIKSVKKPDPYKIAVLVNQLTTEQVQELRRALSQDAAVEIGAVKRPGRPKVRTNCPRCGAAVGARELKSHNCPKRLSVGRPTGIKLKPFHWTDEAIAKLGTATDQEVADELGLTHAAVAGKRMRLKIPAYGSRSSDT